MRRALAVVLAASLLTASGAQAEIVHDGRDVAGPLDLVQVKLGQHESRLLVRLRTGRPLPRLQLLSAHPSLGANERERYLCLNLASPAIGRRLLCPSGRVRHGRIDVGVSVLGRSGVRRKGSVRSTVERGKRSLAIDLELAEVGLKPGKLAFSAQSSWAGSGCEPASGRRGGSCADRAPQQGNGVTRVYPVRRVGCGGFEAGKVSNGPRGRKEVALTFDDGPSIYTPEVLRTLSRHHVHATFFQIAEQVPAYAAYSRRILAQGDELANHTVDHASGPGRDNLARASKIIERATGFRPCMFRPPYGYLPSSTQAAAEALDMVSVLWDVDTRDYTLPGASVIASRATAVQPGSIVLMHDGGGPRSQTVDALPRIITNLKSRGYRLVTMTELLGGHYRLEEVRHRSSDLDPVSARARTTPPTPREGP